MVMRNGKTKRDILKILTNETNFLVQHIFLLQGVKVKFFIFVTLGFKNFMVKTKHFWEYKAREGGEYFTFTVFVRP